MKKIFRNSRIVAVAFLTLFTAVNVNAADSTGMKPTIAAELKHIGMVKNDPVVLLSITSNYGQDDFVISIADKFGNALFCENIKAENFSKKFLLNTSELKDETLIFEIISRKTKQRMRYEVSSKSRCINETTVSLLN